MKKCSRVKNPCKICFDTVTKKTGLQCKGACKKWVHFTCLKYTPGKIKDIKAGIIIVNCPCPTCKTDGAKEFLANPPYNCDVKGCPANVPPKCQDRDCPVNKKSSIATPIPAQLIQDKYPTSTDIGTASKQGPCCVPSCCVPPLIGNIPVVPCDKMNCQKPIKRNIGPHQEPQKNLPQYSQPTGASDENFARSIEIKMKDATSNDKKEPKLKDARGSPNPSKISNRSSKSQKQGSKSLSCTCMDVYQMNPEQGTEELRDKRPATKKIEDNDMQAAPLACNASLCAVRSSPPDETHEGGPAKAGGVSQDSSVSFNGKNRVSSSDTRLLSSDIVCTINELCNAVGKLSDHLKNLMCKMVGNKT